MKLSIRNIFFKFVVLFFTSFFLGASAFAQVSISNVSESDLESLVKEIGANFHQFSLVKANSLEQPYEFGIISGGTNSTTLNRLAGGSTLKSIPHGALFGAGYFANGLTAEVSVLPPTTAQEVKLTSYKAGLKWTANSIFENLPVTISVMGFAGSSKVNWQQSISSINTDMEYSQNFLGLNSQVAYKYLIFEPYAVIGFSNNDGKVMASGAASIFNSSFTTSSSAEKKVSGLNYSAGLNVTQKSLSVGLEIGSYYDIQVNSIKVSAMF